MSNTEVFRQVEHMFRNYHLWQFKLAALQPRSTPREGYLTIAQNMPTGRSSVEALAIERAEISQKIRLVRIALKAMTKDERHYIELRYFSDLPMKVVEREMKWSRAQLYRLRTSILTKAAWLMGFIVAA